MSFDREDRMRRRLSASERLKDHSRKPSFAIGQEESEDSNPFSRGSSSRDFGRGSRDFGDDPFMRGNRPSRYSRDNEGSFPKGTFNGNETKQKENKSTDEMIFDAVTGGVKNIGKKTKEVVKITYDGFQWNDLYDWQSLTENGLILSACVGLVSLIGLFTNFNFFYPIITVTLGLAVIYFLLNFVFRIINSYKGYEKPTKEEKIKIETDEAVSDEIGYEDDVDEYDFEMHENEDEYEDAQQENEKVSILEKVDMNDFFNNFKQQTTSLDENPKGLQDNEDFKMMEATGIVNRKFLVDNMIALSQSFNKTFYEKKELSLNDKTVVNYFEKLIIVAEALDASEDDVLIEKVIRYALYDTIHIKKPSWSKSRISDLGVELQKTLNYVDGEDTKQYSVNVETIGKEMIITVYGGGVGKVGIPDAAQISRDFLENANLPVLVGFDTQGKVLYSDLYNVEGLVVSGTPRGGKSTWAKSTLFQMLALNSPKEVQFYFCDMKSEVSDWKLVRTGHVRQFAKTFEDIMELLNFIIQKEAPRRKEMLAKVEGMINIKDYNNQVDEEDKLPLIYVLIDEMTTIASNTTTEERKQFHDALKVISSQFANLGIRLFLLPHIVKEPIMPKQVALMTPFKLGVMCDEEIQEDLFRMSKKDQKPMFVPGEFLIKAPALKNSNNLIISDVKHAKGFLMHDKEDLQTQKIFDELNRMWLRLCPEYKYLGKES